MEFIKKFLLYTLAENSSFLYLIAAATKLDFCAKTVITESAIT
jgi:hypothetical protein